MGKQRNKNTAQQTDVCRSLLVTRHPDAKAVLTRQPAGGGIRAERVRETIPSLRRERHWLSTGLASLGASSPAIARDAKTERVRRSPVRKRSRGGIEHQAWPGGPLDWEYDSGKVENPRGMRPPEPLQAIRALFIEGLAPGEIAARLDRLLGAVKSRLRLAFGTVCGSQERGS